jgi:TPR repeat protein
MSDEFIEQDFEAMEKQAAQGDPSYAVVLALLYDQRRSDNAEYGKLSVKHYLQAVNRCESPIAAMQLGGKYMRGDGVKQSNVLAFRWYNGAAALNNPIAQHKIGYFYDEGLAEACEVDVFEAIKWYSKAAEFMPDSMHNLAKIYEDGRSGPSFVLEPDIKHVCHVS